MNYVASTYAKCIPKDKYKNRKEPSKRFMVIKKNTR